MGRFRTSIAGGVAAGIVFALGACSGGPDDQGEAGDAATAPGEAMAEAADTPDCPAELPAMAPGAPIQDIKGVRAGLTWDEAANAVRCDNAQLVVAETKMRTYRINTYGQPVRQGFTAEFAKPQQTPQEILEEMQENSLRRSGGARIDPLGPGQVRWYVGTMGLPGKERVLNAAREEYYPADKQPSVQSVEAALTKKYGQPSSRQDSDDWSILHWTFDPTGRPLSEASPVFFTCRGGASPDDSTSFSPDCGVSVNARVDKARGNPGLAKSLAVSTSNGAAGYRALEDSERSLMGVDQNRQAEELKQADQNAAEVEL